MPSLPKSPRACQVPPAGLPPVPVPDVIPDRLPGGGISILAGAPNMGKTALISTILRDLRDGRPIFGHQPRAVPGIGVINTDRGWAKGAGLWLQRAGFPEVPHYSLADDPDFNMKRLRRKFDRTDILASMIDSLGLPPDSVINVDPISLFLGGNLLDYDSCMVACGEIRAYLRERRYTMLATAHSAKLKMNKQDRYMRMEDQVLGSTAISGFSDTSLYLASPQETGKEYYQLVWHPHGAKRETYCLERDPQGLFVPYTGVDTATQARVLALFPADGVTIGFAALVEYAEALPLSKATVKRTLDALLDRGVVERVKHGLYRHITLQ
jgi:AAA domain